MWQFLDQIEIYPLFSQVLFLLNFIPLVSRNLDLKACSKVLMNDFGLNCILKFSVLLPK